MVLRCAAGVGDRSGGDVERGVLDAPAFGAALLAADVGLGRLVRADADDHELGALAGSREPRDLLDVLRAQPFRERASVEEPGRGGWYVS